MNRREFIPALTGAAASSTSAFAVPTDTEDTRLRRPESIEELITKLRRAMTYEVIGIGVIFQVNPVVTPNCPPWCYRVWFDRKGGGHLSAESLVSVEDVFAKSHKALAEHIAEK